MRLLLVEDDAELAAVVTAGLREHGYQVRHAASFAEGRYQAGDGVFDLLILDVMLPGGSGVRPLS